MDDSALQAQDYRPWVESLHAALAANDAAAFAAALQGLYALQNNALLCGVRKITGDLRAALDQFRWDSRLIDLAERQVPDARLRLAHVLKLTDDAAHHTMDLVDQSCPLVDGVARAAEQLRARLALSADAAGSARAELEEFLAQSVANMKTVRARLGDVLLAQGYQDLSGQIIRSVMKLVDELEVALADLIKLDVLPGNAAPARPRPAGNGAHGPAVPGIDHGPAVTGQQDVDAMLSGLGL